MEQSHPVDPPSPLMYLLWVEKMSRDKHTTQNSKGWDVLANGWDHLKELEKAFLSCYFYLEDAYKSYQKAQSMKWGKVLKSEPFAKQLFLEFVMTHVTLSWEALRKELKYN